MATTEKQAPANTDTSKGKLAGEQKKSDAERVPTVTPDNENGDPGAPADKDSSNKGKGPKGENL